MTLLKSDPFSFSVRLGEHRISTELDCDNKIPPKCSTHPVEDIGIEKIIPYKDYSKSTKNNDIALIRLARDVVVTKDKPNINTICLPIEEKQQVENVDDDGKLLHIAGWGRTQFNEQISDVLLTANVSYLSNQKCVAEYNRRTLYSIQDTQMCASSPDGADACKGDSGTGLIGIAETISNKSRMFQHGIVSIGIDCSLNKQFPGIYTRVSNYASWILDNISDE